ncbi:MAG: DUF2207 domain-containing protein [Chitinophagaceae bacterium]|nr:DUF2207 domain-containing protein [Chitinophagaceae bacterium]
MRKTITLLIFLFAVFFAEAQKAKIPTYYFTRTSEYYLTDAEVDSLFYDEATAFLKEQSIPESMIEAAYPSIKSMLQAFGKQQITQAFTILETQQKIKPVDKSLSKFYSNKRLYVEELQVQIRKTFSASKSLSKYTTLNNSDRITSFNSMVRVGTDGKLLVQEEISIHNGNGETNSVYASDGASEDATVNNEIKRGIVRAFPLYYINKYKLFQNTTFKLKEVLRDGKTENYHTENYENGILVYTGSKDIFLDKGTYTYSITYETDHQLKSLKDFDELYWNVTGNGWPFKIDSASCTVILPKGATALSGKCYTGFQGDSAANCNISQTTIGDSVVIVFRATKSLQPYQGLTIATSWPKGFVQNQLSTWQTIKYYVWNNKAVFFLPLAALFSAIFCFIFWFRYGRDPEKGTVYPLFEPPAGYGPAALGYIYHQEFNMQLTAATMVDAAVRHKIKIDVERDGLIFKHNEYVISQSKLPAKQPVSKYEEFWSDIEDLIGSRIEKGKYNKDLGDLNKAVQNYCEDNYKSKDGFAKSKKGFFALNNKYTTLPGLICFAAGIWGAIELFRALYLSNFWQIAYFVGGIILCSLVFRIFSKLLKAYSPEGRQLADKIEGFRMFLSTADEKRFDLMSPPKKSLELYEKYLPFAIALGCENEWGQKFEEIIDTASLDGNVSSGTSFSQSMSRNNNFSSSFASSFSGAISSASSPPSSSSGGGSSFGGGSSGGGGGGGGGGGW